MKKIITLLLCLAFICSAFLFASCDTNNTDESTSSDTNESTNQSNSNQDDNSTLNGKTAEELYSLALEKLQNLTNFEMISTQAITLSYEGESETANQTTITKINGTNCYMKTESELSEEANMEIWYVDEWYYIIKGNIQNKAHLTWDKMQEYMPQGSSGDSILMNFPKEWFKDIQFKQEEEKYYIEFILSGNDYLNYIESNINFGVDMSMLEDISYRVYFDQDGNIGDIVTEFELVVEGISFRCKGTSWVTNIDSTVIEAPEGNFTEVILQ